MVHELGKLTENYPDEPALREAWAKSVTNLINRTAADPDGAQALLGRLGTLATDHPDEPALREEWAKSMAALVVSHLLVERLPDALAVYRALTAFARAAAGEDPWAIGWAVAWRSLWVAARTDDGARPQLLADLEELLPRLAGRTDVAELLAPLFRDEPLGA
jgi:hypothetical protein